MNVPVYWALAHRAQWCEGLIQRFFAGDLWPLPDDLTFEHYLCLPATPADFGIVILPGAWIHDKNLYSEVMEAIDLLDRGIIIHSGDEEVAMDSGCLVAGGQERHRLLVQAPRPHHEGSSLAKRHLLYGWPEDTRRILATVREKFGLRWKDRGEWSFVGQNNHAFRNDCVDQLRKRGEDSAFLAETGGFAQGMPREDYLAIMANHKVVPCPSGPQSPETFRLYEALEAGCIPIAQRRAPAGGWPEGFNYWTWRYGSIPFPTVETWDEAHGWLDLYRDPALAQSAATRCSAWWILQKREEAQNLVSDINELTGALPTGSPPVTVIITSSPCPRTDNLDMITDCIAKVRSYPELARAEVILCLDGVRPDLEHRRAAYRDYCRDVVDKANWDPAWFGVLPVVFDEWTHQAGMVRRALELVRTPLVLMVEADCAPMGDIPWGDLIGAFGEPTVNHVRLHIFDRVLAEHQHLYDAPCLIGGVPLLPTRQWSQRPHLARATWLRGLIDEHFPPGSMGFIEDRMCSPSEAGEVGGLFVYAPAGSLLRSITVDGRGSDAKAPAFLGDKDAAG